MTSNVVSKEMQPQHEKEQTIKDEKENKKERKKDEKADSVKKEKKEKANKEQKCKNDDKKDGDTKKMKKEKKKKEKRKGKNGGSKENSSSSDSSSSAEDEVAPKQANDSGGAAAASRRDTRLSDGGGVDITVALIDNAVDGEKRNAATDVDGARIAELSRIVSPMPGKIVIQADTEASVPVDAHIDLSGQRQMTRKDANVIIKVTDDVGGDGGGGAMSVDIVLSSGGDGEVAIYGDSGRGSNHD